MTAERLKNAAEEQAEKQTGRDQQVAQQTDDRYLLGPEDRGRQKQRMGGASKAALRTAKEDAANRKGMRGFVERIEGLIYERDPLAQVTDQLSSPLVLHSLAVPANGKKILQSMARLNNRVQGFIGARKEQINDAADALVKAILAAQRARLERGDNPADILSSTERTLLSSRNLAVLGDPSLAQLLLRVQTGVEISFVGLGNVFDKAGEIILDKARAAEDDFPPQIIEALIIPTQNFLRSAKPFIDLAERGRLKGTGDSFEKSTQSIKGIEAREGAFSRATDLVPIMAILADEILTARGEERAGQAVSKILVEAFFSTRIQWAMPELTIQALCQQLSGMGYSETAKKLILQARLANLLNLGLESDAEKFYHESGFESGLARSHQRRILEYKRRWKYSSNPTENLPPGTNRCGLLLGCYNAAHNGQRILAAGGHWALNPPFRYQEGLETPLAISINQKDPDRERRAKQGKIPFFSQKARIPLALNNFAGLSVCLTSIDTVTGPKLPPPERIEAFGEMTKMEIVRVCGHDRKEYTPPHANPVLIGFRGLDLRRYIENPKKFDKLQEELEGQEVVLLVLQGAENISSTLVFNRARDAEQLSKPEDREGALCLFTSYVHPKNVGPIRNMVRSCLAGT